MSRDKRITAVLGKQEMLLTSAGTVEMMKKDGLLFEGWETRYDVYYGVMPGYDLADLQEWIRDGRVSKAHFIPYGPNHYEDTVTT
jgi:hypothetical protein